MKMNNLTEIITIAIKRDDLEVYNKYYNQAKEKNLNYVLIINYIRKNYTNYILKNGK